MTYRSSKKTFISAKGSARVPNNAPSFSNAVIKPRLQSSSSHLALIYREIIVQIILVQINWVN